jgi:predicted kinase
MDCERDTQNPLVLTVLSGLPGAGKTSTARRITLNVDAVVVSRDDIRKKFDYIDESDLTLLLVHLAASLLCRGTSVIVDSWNLHPRDMIRWTELARLSTARLDWVHLSTPLNECIRRDSLRPLANGEQTVRSAAADHAQQLSKLARMQSNG